MPLLTLLSQRIMLCKSCPKKGKEVFAEAGFLASLSWYKVETQTFSLKADLFSVFLARGSLKEQKALKVFKQILCQKPC